MDAEAGAIALNLLANIDATRAVVAALLAWPADRTLRHLLLGPQDEDTTEHEPKTTTKGTPNE